MAVPAVEEQQEPTRASGSPAAPAGVTPGLQRLVSRAARLRWWAAAAALATCSFWLGTRFPAGLPFGDGPGVHLTAWAPAPPPPRPRAGIAVATPPARHVMAADTAPTVNINTATVADLRRVLRVRRATAERIVRYRQSHGPFTTLDDLLAIPLSRGTVERIAPRVVFR